MAKYYYWVSGETLWQSQSGTAILAIVNKNNSGKKIDINSVQIHPQTFFGGAGTAATLANVTPNFFRVVPVTALSGGTTWTPTKLDTSATFTSTVQVKLRSAYTASFVDVTGSYTDATVAIGDTTFTPGSAPGWLLDQYRYMGYVLNVAAGGNAGQYRITSNSTTACVIETGLVAAGSTTATIQQMSSYFNVGVIKNYSVAGIGMGQLLGIGKRSQQGRQSQPGMIWSGTNNSALQRIKIKQGEKVALVAYPLHISMPVFVELMLTVEGTPNRTYYYHTFMNVVTETETIFSIDNNAGSGEVVHIDSVKITEVGTFDTPYFQLVPLGSIDPGSLNDANKKITPYTLDSSTPTLSSTVCEVFTNAATLPSGAIPQVYIPEGAAAAAVPKGYNYLNTKDFAGPVYMTYFPEITPISNPSAHLGNWTAGTSGWTSNSMALSSIKGRQAPIVIRQNEQVGLVSGAETATAASAMAQSGWHSFFFSINFSVEDAAIITITVLDINAAVVAGARVRIEKTSDSSLVIEGTTDVSGILTSTYNYPGSDVPVRIRVRKASAAPKYLPFETLGTVTSSGLSATCVILADSIAI